MMWKNKLTLMLIPDSKGISKQFSIRVSLIYAATALVLVLLLADFFLSAEFFADRVNTKELERLRTENKELMERYEQLRWNVAEIESRYQDLVDKEVTIRTAFDLPEINTEERQLGIGGPIPPAVAAMTPSQRQAYITEVQVDRLLRMSEYELDKYSEVEQSLQGIKDRLDHTPSIWPTKGWKSSGYGMRYDPFTGYKQMHRGIDIANRHGTPVVATADGRVTLISKNGQLGRIVVIDHGYGFKTRYAHLAEAQVKRGQTVNRGDIIALMGASGYATGPHLHYEIVRNGKWLDPGNFILNEM
ncbi:MAG: M23 family metallopeptidase [candidate division Zixibacteria bacterium]|nr:M23 family metallopeptidase [candidate division Zixibacteria bacterium]